MSVILKAIKNTNEQNAKTNGKYYPRVVNIGTMELDDLCDHIMEHGSIYTADVVTGVVKKFIACIPELLLDSHKVRLDGIGTFYLKPRYHYTQEDGTVVEGGAATEEDLNVQNVDFTIGFTPDRSDDSRFVGPNLSRKAKRKSLKAIGLAEDEEEETSPNPSEGTASPDPSEGGENNQGGGGVTPVTPENGGDDENG